MGAVAAVPTLQHKVKEGGQPTGGPPPVPIPGGSSVAGPSELRGTETGTSDVQQTRRDQSP